MTDEASPDGAGGEGPPIEMNYIQRSIVRTLFTAFDTSGDGLLTLDDFVTNVHSFASPEGGGGEAPPEHLIAEAQGYFDQCDSNGDGSLTFEDFCNVAQLIPEMRQMLLKVQKRDINSEMREHLRERFNALDVSNTGTVSREEMFQASPQRAFGETYDACSQDVKIQFDATFRALDVDCDGVVSWDDFYTVSSSALALSDEVMNESQ